MKTVDRRLDYKGLHGCKSFCNVKFFAPCVDDKVVVMFTELPDNPGTSITNWIEHLIQTVMDHYDLPRNSVWVEHYPASKIRGETYDLVRMSRTGSVDWQHITKQDFLDLISPAELPVCI
jgi:hypothetical protein